MTENDDKRLSEKRKNPLLSFIYVCLGFALTTYVVSLLLGYDFVDMFGIWEILIYLVIGVGVLLGYVATRKPRKRTSRDSLEHKSKE